MKISTVELKARISVILHRPSEDMHWKPRGTRSNLPGHLRKLVLLKPQHSIQFLPSSFDISKVLKVPVVQYRSTINCSIEALGEYTINDRTLCTGFTTSVSNHVMCHLS